MSKMQWLFLIIYMLIPTGINESYAGGRLKSPQIHPWADTILVNTWSRDGHISITVCNLADEDRPLKIGLGLMDKNAQIWGDTTIALAGNSLTLVSFPMIQQQTPQGDLKTADHVFITADTPADRGIIKSLSIQHIKNLDCYPELAEFLIQKQAVFRYTVTDTKTLTIVFIPKSIETNKFTIKARTITGPLQNLTTERDIKNLNLPTQYEKDILSRLQENYCLLFKPGSTGTAMAAYEVLGLERCVLVHIPAYTYRFNADGSVLAGGGQGLTLMAYNPEKIFIQPFVNLTINTGKKRTCTP